MGKIFSIGDIHGNYKGLMQCLERSKFDYENDILISLGDVVDGHSQSFEVVEELLKIKNLIAIKGNHDDWFNIWLLTGKNPTNWTSGQKATGISYLEKSRPSAAWLKANEELSGWKENIQVSDIPQEHIKFFSEQFPYFIDSQNRLFVHGGFDRLLLLQEQDEDIFWWDRELWKKALSFQATVRSFDPTADVTPQFKMAETFNEIFLGHTTTMNWNTMEPMHAANIWNLDTGGGWTGKVSIMDVNTHEYWQSNTGNILYPEFKGR